MGLLSILLPAHSIFSPPSTLELILLSPLKYLLRHLRRVLLYLRGPTYTPHSTPIRIICISDTHTDTPPIPPGDLLIHAGDLTNAGTVPDIQAQIDWLKALPHAQKVVICGNHDTFFDVRSRPKGERDARDPFDWGGIHYLQHSSVTLSFPEHGDRKLNIYGAPQIPKCGGKEFAFQYLKGSDAWTGTVPMETDVLVTHTPPQWHLDLPVGLGDPYLLNECWRVKPTLHVCGHIHAGYGRTGFWWDEEQRYYERVMGRKDGGVFWDMLSLGMWVDCLMCVGHGVMGVVWRRVWGGHGGGGVLVNAALMHHTSKQVVNKPQVVEL